MHCAFSAEAIVFLRLELPFCFRRGCFERSEKLGWLTRAVRLQGRQPHKYSIPRLFFLSMFNALITLSNDDYVYYYNKKGGTCGVIDVDTLMFANEDTISTLEETKELLKTLDTEKALQDTILIALALLKNG